MDEGDEYNVCQCCESHTELQEYKSMDESRSVFLCYLCGSTKNRMRLLYAGDHDNDLLGRNIGEMICFVGNELLKELSDIKKYIGHRIRDKL